MRNSNGQFIKGHNAGKDSHFWKGDKVGYHGIHKWLINIFGKASKCEQCNSLKNVQWAKLKGKEYKRERENFWMLCSKCHTKYDNKSPGGWNKGKKATSEMIEKNRISHLGQKPWNKGIPGEQWDGFHKGYTPWNKGLKLKQLIN